MLRITFGIKKRALRRLVMPQYGAPRLSNARTRPLAAHVHAAGTRKTSDGQTVVYAKLQGALKPSFDHARLLAYNDSSRRSQAPTLDVSRS